MHLHVQYIFPIADIFIYISPHKRHFIFSFIQVGINLQILSFQLFTSLHCKIQTEMLFQWKIQIRRFCITISGCIHPLVEYTVYSECDNKSHGRSNSFQKVTKIKYIYIHFLFLNFKRWQPEWYNGEDAKIGGKGPSSNPL